MKNSLLLRIVAAIALGIAAAWVLPEWAARGVVTFNALFSSLLNFVIPLLIVGFVAPAIAETGRRAGAMLGLTVLIAYLMTFGSGMLSYFTAAALFPSMAGDVVQEASASCSAAPLPFFTLAVEPLMSVMTALATAFLVGFGCAISGESTPALRSLLNDFRSLISLVIGRLIVPLLPVYIFGIFLSITVEGAVAPVLLTFVKIIAVIFVLHVGLLLLQFGVASLFSGKNPLRALRTMLPAYATALGTQSSAATIPVTLERTVAVGVSRPVASFVVPLCATIHMSGSTLKIVACAVALMIVQGLPFDASMFAAFVAMLGVTIIAAPGVPGGAIMASLGLLTSVLGFSEADNALMIALYIAMDSFGTACNITGDCAIAQIVDRFFGLKKNKIADGPVTAAE